LTILFFSDDQVYTSCTPFYDKDNGKRLRKKIESNDFICPASDPDDSYCTTFIADHLFIYWHTMQAACSQIDRFTVADELNKGWTFGRMDASDTDTE
jgi:hypothetical protein